MTPTIDQIEPPTREQWQQMREDYEQWLKEYASDPDTYIIEEPTS